MVNDGRQGKPLHTPYFLRPERVYDPALRILVHGVVEDLDKELTRLRAVEHDYASLLTTLSMERNQEAFKLMGAESYEALKSEVDRLNKRYKEVLR